MSESVVEIRDVVTRFGRQVVHDGVSLEIRRGEAGAAVDIVMEMAAYAEPAWNGGGIFDSGFENWLRTFQQHHGLKADGIIGPNTRIYLMAPTIREPRLIVADEENS